MAVTCVRRQFQTQVISPKELASNGRDNASSFRKKKQNNGIAVERSVSKRNRKKNISIKLRRLLDLAETYLKRLGFACLSFTNSNKPKPFYRAFGKTSFTVIFRFPFFFSGISENPRRDCSLRNFRLSPSIRSLSMERHNANYCDLSGCQTYHSIEHRSPPRKTTHLSSCMRQITCLIPITYVIANRNVEVNAQPRSDFDGCGLMH